MAAAYAVAAAVVAQTGVAGIPRWWPGYRARVSVRPT